jgi:hypothetical protein
MTLRKRLGTLAVAVIFVLGALLHPTPARADTEEAFILAGVAIAAYIAFLVIGTSLAYRDGPVEHDGNIPGEFMPGAGGQGASDLDAYLARHAARGERVEFGPRCARPGAQLTLLCW